MKKSSNEVRAMCESEMIAAIQTVEKLAREEAITAVKDRVIAHYEEQEAEEETLKQVQTLF